MAASTACGGYEPGRATALEDGCSLLNALAMVDAPTVRARSLPSPDANWAGGVSDVHFDVRPTFAAEGLADVVDAFVLSYEVGVQKPDPAIFQAAIAALGATASETPMVGDRQLPDGGAVGVGVTTLLLPRLTHVRQRRLHQVTSLLGGFTER